MRYFSHVEDPQIIRPIKPNPIKIPKNNFAPKKSVVT